MNNLLSIGLLLLSLFISTATGRFENNITTSILSPLPQATGDRALIFQNHCSQTVWIGATGGFTQDCNNGACPAGQACLTIRSPPGCFWVLPTPSIGRWYLNPGEKSSVALNNGPYRGVKWSGNVYGKTGCKDNSGRQCETGDCGTCGPGVGPSGPASLAEFTFIYSGVDTYDVSLINGVNVPISMGPTPNQNLPPPNGNDYWCGNPGGRNPSNSALVGCNWQFDTTINGADLSTYLYLVPPGGSSCSRQSDCGGGQVCGTDMTQRARVCGSHIGYWTADELCGYGYNGYPFDCSSSVPGQGNHASLFGCAGANSGSCYQHGAPSQCCGCPHWSFDGKSLPAGIQCQNNNPYWQNIAYPYARFVKSACPMAYSFPYDDATSTFQCMTTASPNSADYTITFCP